MEQRRTASRRSRAAPYAWSLWCGRTGEEEECKSFMCGSFHPKEKEPT
jgi:hypothetical protein